MREAGTISAKLAETLLSTLAAKGCDAHQLSAKLGVPDDDNGIWPLAQFTAILEAAALEKRDPLFGHTLGKAYGLNGLGPVAPLLRSCKTTADALSKLTQYLPAFQTYTEYGFAISGHEARISYRIIDPTVKLRQQDAIFTMAMERSILCELAGAEIKPQFVDLQHLPDSAHEAGEYKALFDCDVRFGRNENAIVFSTHHLTEPRPGSDDLRFQQLENELASTIQARGKQIGLSSSLSAWMTAAMSVGASIDLEHAASDFGLSVRSFQRKLAEHKVNYLDLRNTVRRQVAERLLRNTPLPVTSIALYLGYSETSAFCRNFKRETGVTPSQIRDRNRDAELQIGNLAFN